MKSLLGALLVVSLQANSQVDSCRLKISLLTCTPGEELYSLFGHSAMRVTDSTSGMDIIFNYGTFDFTNPNFYTEFVLGKLLYFLSVEAYADFAYSYQLEGRGIIEQELQLTCQESNTLFNALRENAQEANRYYKYDFLFDNCTTRLRDIVKARASGVVFGNILPNNPPSFRDLIHVYLDSGKQYWSKFGIDMLLGMKLDKKVSNQQSMFLPDYLLMGFDSAVIHSNTRPLPLVDEKRVLLRMTLSLDKKSWFGPQVAFYSLLFLFIILGTIKSNWARQTLGFFSFVFYFFIGLAGCLIVFMWTATEHTVCRDNLNLFWALPTHLPIAFVIHHNKKWIRKYFRIVFWLTLAFILSWFVLPQEINPAVAPLLLIILFTSYLRFKTLDATAKTVAKE